MCLFKYYQNNAPFIKCFIAGDIQIYQLRKVRMSTNVELALTEGQKIEC